MRQLRRVVHRIIGFIAGARQDDDLAAEMRSHLQLHIDEQVRHGASPEEARRVAMLRLGGVEAVKEAYRDQRGLPRLDALRQDLRYTRRLVSRNPGFYAAIVLILGGTLGLCSIVFSVAHAILLRPLPYGDPDRLVRIHDTSPAGQNFAVAAGNAFSWRDERAIFEDIALFRSRTFELTAGSEPVRLQGALVSANLFDVLRTQPWLGRAFAPGEDETGKSDLAIISHGLWMRRFGARPDIVGQSIQVDARPFQIIGVLPSTFEFPAAPVEFASDPVDLVAPIDWTPEARATRGNHQWRAIGRLRDGVTLAQTRQAMTVVAARLAETYPSNRRWGVYVEPLDESIVGQVGDVVTLLLGGVIALLVIGCANIANLLLARGVARRREFVLRAALGGSARRVARQVFTESLVLATGSVLAGLAFAYGGLHVFLSAAPKDLPRLPLIALDARSVAATVAVAMVTALVFGAVPAWLAGRTRPADALRASGRGSVGGRLDRRFQGLLVAGQIAMTVVLLVGAGLLLRSALLLQRAPIGFDPSQIVTGRIVLDKTRYPGDGERWRFLDGLLEQLRAQPGVERAAAVSFAPLIWGDSLGGFRVVGAPPPETGRGPSALVYGVSPDYFEMMGVPLLAGRTFTTRDRGDAAGVVIVNDLLARKHLAVAGRDPVGTRVTFGARETFEVVGVVGDTRHYGVDRPAQEQIYFPYAQFPSVTTSLLVKTSLPVEAIVPAIRRVVSERDPRQPVSNVMTYSEAIGAKMARPRLSAALLSTFAGLALVLAGAGVFALLSYLVGQRSAEMGLRMALGAQRWQVLRLVMGGGLRLAALGLVAGLAIAWPVARWLQSLLYEIEPHDPLTFATVGIVVVSAALLACAAPARRAARVDPATALRSE